MSFLDEIKELRIQYLKAVINEIDENIKLLEKESFYDKIREFAHRIKGSGASYGFDFITEKAILISEMAKSFKSSDEIKKVLNTIRDFCESNLRVLSGEV